MSKPRKDRSTPSGSTPVDATGANDAAKTSAVKSGADAKAAAGDVTDSKLASKSTPTSATKTTESKKSTAPSARTDAAADLARRTTAKKVRVTGGDNPTWWVPTMVTLMLVGLFWLVITYLSQGQYPLPSLGVIWNLGVGFGLVMLGFLMTTRWK
ncbi:MAG: cell division protein CrgA [Allobranchiibius sp.]